MYGRCWSHRSLIWQVLEYGLYLGMVFPEDKAHLWIAEQA